MSMNIRLVGRQGKRVNEFQVYQTPTEISYRIQKAKDPIQEYKNWYLTWQSSEQCQEHFSALDKWVEEVKAMGVRIEVLVQ